MNKIEPRIIRLIQDKNIVVLRDKTGRALNVSYTPAGLTWTTNAVGKLIFYKNAKLKAFNTVKDEWSEDSPGFVAIVSSDGKPLEINPDLYVEKFVPTDKYDSRGNIDRKGQVAEYTWTDKAYRLITNSALSPDAYASAR